MLIIIRQELNNILIFSRVRYNILTFEAFIIFTLNNLKSIFMKKFLFLFLSLALMTACSEDDEAETGGEDPIIGTWILVGSSIANPQTCSEESTITFNENGTGSATFYFAEAECEPQSSSGNWQNLGNSRYSVVVPVAGTVEGIANFTNNNDAFTFTTTFGNFSFERQ